MILESDIRLEMEKSLEMKKTTEFKRTPCMHMLFMSGL